MKNINKFATIFLMGSMLFAFSHNGDGNREMSKQELRDQKYHEYKILKELDLSDEKISEIKNIKEKTRKDHIASDKKLRDNRKLLIKELDNESFSQDNINKYKKEILKTQEEKLDIMIKMKEDLKNTLTTEQIKKLKEISEQRRKRRK
jgi:Spy/CpxP family protein refolding chaperone